MPWPCTYIIGHFWPAFWQSVRHCGIIMSAAPGKASLRRSEREILNRTYGKGEEILHPMPSLRWTIFDYTVYDKCIHMDITNPTDNLSSDINHFFAICSYANAVVPLYVAKLFSPTISDNKLCTIVCNLPLMRSHTSNKPRVFIPKGRWPYNWGTTVYLIEHSVHRKDTNEILQACR